MNKVLLWDNHGTITGFVDPKNPAHYDGILPNVEALMRAEGTHNIICSGTSTKRDYDPEKIIEKFSKLMTELPICAAVFSPDAAGKQCWVITKKNDGSFVINQAHSDERYTHLAGSFKKPATGMITVIRDLLHERGIAMHEHNTVFVGDSWQDLRAAHNAQLPFLHASHIHRAPKNSYTDNLINWHHGQELIDAWKDFFANNNWQKLIKNVSPVQGERGTVYDLPNYLDRANEGIAIVDMRNTICAAPHYHPDLEVYIVLQGTALVAVGSDTFHAKTGEVIVVWPFNGHYIIPDGNFVLACVNVPPYTPASHIPLTASDETVDFDYDSYQAAICGLEKITHG